MKIGLAADHAGFKLKEKLKSFLEGLGHEVKDFGASEMNSDDDYPDFVIPAAKAVAAGDVERVVVLGGSGQGEAMAANRIKGVRAAVFYGNVEPRGLAGKVGEVRDVVTLSRLDNAANVLAIAGSFVNVDDAQEAVQRFLETDFSGDERHVRRIEKLDASS